MTNSIANNVLIVSVEINGFTGNKVDRNLSRETATNHSADEKELGKFTRKLLGNFEPLKNINNFATSVRQQIDDISLPFGRAQRLIPADRLMEFFEKVSAAKETHNELVQKMIDAIPAKVEELREKQGDAFREDLVPSETELRSKFRMSTSVVPLPENSNFEKVLGIEDLVEELQENFQEDLSNRLGNAEQHIKGKLKDRLSKFHDKLLTYKTGDRAIQQRVIDNTYELSQNLCELNITGNEEIEKCCEETSRLFTSADASLLSQNDAIRNNFRAQLNAIITRL